MLVTIVVNLKNISLYIFFSVEKKNSHEIWKNTKLNLNYLYLFDILYYNNRENAKKLEN